MKAKLQAVLKGLILAAAVIAIAHVSSCAPQVSPVPPGIAAIIPKVTASVSPKLTEAQRESASADAQAAISAERLRQAQAGAISAQARARAALAEAERLEKQKTATEKELAAQSDLIRGLDKAIAEMEVVLAGAAQSLMTERDMRQKIGVMLEDAHVQSREKDTECETLRASLNQTEVKANTYYQAAQENSKAALTAQGAIAKAQGSVRTWRNIAIVFAVVAGLFVLFFVVMPLTRKVTLGI